MHPNSRYNEMGLIGMCVH